MLLKGDSPLTDYDILVPSLTEPLMVLYGVGDNSQMTSAKADKGLL